MARAQGPIEQVIRQRVAEHPQSTWLKWKADEVPWADVLSNAQRAANGLLELGARPGERVAILMGNRPEFLWAHLGILFIGALSVPVNISQRGRTLQHILADSDSVAVILQDDLVDALEAVRSGVSFLRRGGGVGMMYTSGTTGPPKGVVATKYDTGPLGLILRAGGVQPGETMYTPLPLSHGNALLVSALGSMMLDAKLALAERFSASRFFDDCRRYDAVSFNTLGGMISILLKQPPRPDDTDNPVRTVLSAGCPPDRWEELERRFGVRIVEWFGMVDSPGFLLNTEHRVGSMGKPIAGIEFRVVDDNDQPLDPKQVGELQFRHPLGRMTHYHKLPEATDEAYQGGWFHTGDLAEQDDDGFFYYRGRKKEAMRRLGENISAWEIETVVNSHPDVRECAAHAVRSVLGEDEVKLIVVAQPGAKPTPVEILDYCTGRMAHYAVPRYVEFVDQLPKTGTERIQYAALKERGITSETWDREQAGYKVSKV